MPKQGPNNKVQMCLHSDEDAQESERVRERHLVLCGECMMRKMCDAHKVIPLGGGSVSQQW